MDRSQAILRLVNRIYEGAVEPGAWPGIVQDITEFFESPKGLLLTNFIGPEDGGINISTGISQRSLDIWNARYIPHDMWTQAAVRKGYFREGAVAIGSDLVPDSEFMQSKIYRELLVHEGVARVCAGFIFTASTGGVLPTTIGVYRGLPHAPYEPADREALRVLVPHLSRSLGVMFRLRDAELKRVASLEALDRLATGVLLLDRRGTVHHLNAEAQRILEAADGLSLSHARGGGPQLIATNLAAAPALALAIQSALRNDVLEAPHFANTVSIARSSGRRPYLLQFAPLPETNNFGAGSVAAIVFVNDPDKPFALDMDALKNLFGITPAEARLAACLCAGETLAEAALRCTVGLSTAKTQLATLYQKTNTHSQAQLVRLLLSLASTRP